MEKSFGWLRVVGIRFGVDAEDLASLVFGGGSWAAAERLGDGVVV
jgi:hypothetical protein